MIPRDSGFMVPLMLLLTVFGIMMFVTKCGKENEKPCKCKCIEAQHLKEFGL